MEIQRRNIKFMTRGKLYWIIRHCNVYLTPVKKIIYKVKQRELWLVTHKKNNAKSVLREEMLLRGSRQALYSYLIGRLDSWQQNRKMLKESALNQEVGEMFTRLGELVYERSVSDIMVAKYVSELRKQFSVKALAEKLDKMESISHRKTSSITMMRYAKAYERLKTMGIEDSVIIKFSLIRWIWVLNICGEQKINDNYTNIIETMTLNQGKMIKELKTKYKRDEDG